MDQRTPNLFVIGAPKAGTTLIHHALGLVEGIAMSAVKEPGYFLSDRDYGRGLDYYLDAYFSRARGHAVRGESTPWYLYSEVARRRIAALAFPDAPRFVVSARRPSDRAVSMYRDQVRIKREVRSFEEAIGTELDGLGRGELGPDLRRRYVWCGQYAEHIDAWQKMFGPDRVHVTIFEDLASSPQTVWEGLDRFLPVPLGHVRFDEVSERDRNPSGSLRWPRLDEMVRSYEGRDSRVVEAAKGLLPPGAHRRVLQAFGRLNRTPDTAGSDDFDIAVRRQIDDACRPSTARIEALLERDLPEWSPR